MDNEGIVRLGWKMDRLVGIRRSLINREADENGVYLGQHRVLRYIAKHPGCSQRDIAEALSQTPAAITLSTKRLQEIGLITKETDPENLRRYHLFVTDKGRRNGESFMRVIDKNAELSFKGFSDEELEVLEGFVDRIYYNLKPYRDEVCSQDMREERKE
ncbi:MAG: MarR family transcriptional regulator [Oscillospiraceae bacterium]|nr:MarR family transcriptional regulator [Oscillospiraceae bacterium]